MIDKERRLVVTKAWGRVTFAEIRAHQREFTSDPEFDPEFNLLIDATETEKLELSIDEAKIVASQGLFSPTSRRAFLASSPAIFGMGRLMGAYHAMATKREQVCVFYNRAAALNWLGLKDDQGSKQ